MWFLSKNIYCIWSLLMIRSSKGSTLENHVREYHYKAINIQNRVYLRFFNVNRQDGGLLLIVKRQETLWYAASFCSTLSFIVKSSVAFIAVVGFVCFVCCCSIMCVSQSHMMLQAGIKVYHHRVTDRQTQHVDKCCWCNLLLPCKVIKDGENKEASIPKYFPTPPPPMSCLI